MTYLPLPSRKFLFALFILFFFPFLLIGQQIDKDFGDKGFLLSNYTSPHSQFGHGTIRTLSHGGYMLAGDHAVDQIGVQLITDAFRQIWFRRMKADGNPDTSFGNNGLKVHTIKDKFDAVITHQYADRGQYFFILREPTLDYHIYIFDENGEPDSLYGQNGIVAIPTLTGTMARMQSIHCKSLPNGDIIVAFLAFKESIIWYKLKPDGTIDNSFGNNGNRSLMDNSVISIKRLKVYGDSLIVTLTTHSGTGNFTSKLFVQSTDGLADTTFNQSGERDCPSSSDLHRFSDGRICVLSSTDISMYDKQGVQLARKFFYSLPQFPTESYLNRMGVDLQGRLLLSGDSQENLFCARLDQDFDIDTAFGNQGYQRFMPLGNPIRSYIGIDRQLAVSLDQWMVLMSRHGVAKLDSTGMLDSDFGLQGVEPLYKPVSSIAWEEICQDSKGKVWTAGMNLDHEIVIGKFDLQQNKQELQFTIPPHEEQDWYNPDIVTDMVAMPDDGFLLMGLTIIRGLSANLQKQESRIPFSLKSVNTSKSPSQRYSQVEISWPSRRNCVRKEPFFDSLLPISTNTTKMGRDLPLQTSNFVPVCIKLISIGGDFISGTCFSYPMEAFSWLGNGKTVGDFMSENPYLMAVLIPLLVTLVGPILTSPGRTVNALFTSSKWTMGS